MKVSDVNVVNRRTLRKALGGTIVGNTMEWYDVGVFGYLITTMGPVFLPEADRAMKVAPKVPSRNRFCTARSASGRKTGPMVVMR